MGLSRHDAYYEPEDNDDDEKIDNEVRELMLGEYNPFIYSNFAEALQEAKDSDREIVEDMLRQPLVDINYEILGRKLHTMAWEYWESCSEALAADRLVKGYLS